MPGIASVIEAIMWLENEGTMWRMMIRSSLAPVQTRADDEVLRAQGEEATAHHPRQPGPADEREDDGDSEIDAKGGPVVRASRRPGPSTTGWSAGSAGTR